MLSPLQAFVDALPKVELHVHHVGSAPPATVARLAERYAGSTPVPADPNRLSQFFTFTDFAHFVEVYLAVVDLLRDPQDLADLTYDVGAGLAAQQVRYAEVTLTPFSSIARGIPAAAYCEAVEDARRRVARDHGTELRWCFDFPGDYGSRAADVTLDVAVNLRPEGLVSFGVGGGEAGVPRSQFASHFRAARAEGLRSVPHAGESTGPETIWDALRHLDPDRIGHGIAAARDEALLQHLAERQIALEVCPTSNVCTRSVPSLAEHPLPTLVAAGVPVTINSDDPPMFSTSLNQEYLVAASLLGLDVDGVAELARQGVRRAFLADAGKAAILTEIDSYLAAWHAGEASPAAPQPG
ncbi:MAG: adenosine deaminase [Dermatophilaceae bacterium]